MTNADDMNLVGIDVLMVISPDLCSGGSNFSTRGATLVGPPKTLDSLDGCLSEISLKSDDVVNVVNDGDAGDAMSRGGGGIANGIVTSDPETQII